MVTLLQSTFFCLQKRELRIRQSDLQRLKHSFEDFSEYRVGEKRSIETFSKYLNNHEVMKKVAKEVLAELASRIEKDDADDSDDSQDLCKFLACIVAPRCSFLPASADKDLAMLAAQLDARLTIVSKERDTSS